MKGEGPPTDLLFANIVRNFNFEFMKHTLVDRWIIIFQSKTIVTNYFSVSRIPSHVLKDVKVSFHHLQHDTVILSQNSPKQQKYRVRHRRVRQIQMILNLLPISVTWHDRKQFYIIYFDRWQQLLDVFHILYCGELILVHIFGSWKLKILGTYSDIDKNLYYFSILIYSYLLYETKHKGKPQRWSNLGTELPLAVTNILSAIILL